VKTLYASKHRGDMFRAVLVGVAIAAASTLGAPFACAASGLILDTNSKRRRANQHRPPTCDPCEKRDHQ